MSLITLHWSGGDNQQNNLTRRDYHIAYGAKADIEQSLIARLLPVTHAADVDWNELRALFDIEKNTNFSIATAYATWEMNHDPRDQTPNIEVAMLGMGGHGVSAKGPSWGEYPFTIAHFFMAAGIIARIAMLKGIDTGGVFDAGQYGFQNGPLHNISTHAERAIQTPDPQGNENGLGYFIFSGDPDSRWDVAARDVSFAHELRSPATAKASAIATADLLRHIAHEIKLSDPTDMWGLDAAA